MTRTHHHLLLLGAACAITFWNIFYNGFHLDDAFRVVNNPGVQEFWPPWRHFVDPGTCSHLERLVQYRPMLPLSLSINYAIAGDSLAGYHIGNLVLQFLASTAVYLFVRELLTHWSKVEYPRHAALVIAGLFAVHPVSGIPVNYICGRDLLMMQMFLFASLTSYARMLRLGETKGRWALTLGLLLLALLSKKNAVVAPALIFFFDLLLVRASLRNRGIWRRTAMFAGVVALLLLFIKFGLGFSDYANVVTHSQWHYATAQAQHHVFHYLRNFAWPFSIRVLPSDPLEVWKQIAGAAFIVVSLVGAGLWWRSRPLLAFSILGYAAMLAVTSSVIPMHSEIVPYRAYPSGAFLFLFVGAILLRKGKMGALILGTAIVYFVVASMFANTTWRDSVTLLRHSAKRGANFIAYAMLGEKLPFGTEKREMLERAITLSPGFVEAQLLLAMTDVKMGETKKGLDRLQEWVAKEPRDAQVRYAAGRIWALAGNARAAATQSALAVQLDPDNIEYRHMAGELAIGANQFAQAYEILKPLVGYRPDYKSTTLHAGIALLELNRSREAIPLLSRYATTYGTNPAGWYALGRARMNENDWAGATQALGRCLSLDAGYRDARQLLAECERRRGA